MQTNISPVPLQTETLQTFSRIPPERLTEYLGGVTIKTNERVLNEVKLMLRTDPLRDIYVLVTSTGGPTGSAMSFYDTMRTVLRAPLVTIGSGDVDSSGIIIFLTGERRYVTKHTTLLFHMAGRCFDGTRRYTAQDIEAMVHEDKIKDAQYAEVVAQNSHGKLLPKEVLEMMERSTILTSSELVALGLADSILE